MKRVWTVFGVLALAALFVVGVTILLILVLPSEMHFLGTVVLGFGVIGLLGLAAWLDGEVPRG